MYYIETNLPTNNDSTYPVFALLIPKSSSTLYLTPRPLSICICVCLYVCAYVYVYVYADAHYVYVYWIYMFCVLAAAVEIQAYDDICKISSANLTSNGE